MVTVAARLDTIQQTMANLSLANLSLATLSLSRPASINDLPKELLPLIFKSLPTKTLWGDTRVCKRWYAVINGGLAREAHYKELIRTVFNFRTYNLEWHQRLDFALPPRYTRPSSTIVSCPFHGVRSRPLDSWKITQANHEKITVQSGFNQVVLDLRDNSQTETVLERLPEVTPPPIPPLAHNVTLTKGRDQTGYYLQVRFPDHSVPIATIAHPTKFSHVASGDDFFIKTDAELIRYSLAPDCARYHWHKDASNTTFVGFAGDKLVVLNKDDPNAPKVLCLSMNNGSQLAQWSAGTRHPRTSLVGPSLVIRSKKRVRVIDLEHKFKQVLNVNFDKKILDCFLSNMQAAFLLKDGRLCYMKL